MLVKGNAEVTVTLPSDREIAFTRILRRRSPRWRRMAHRDAYAGRQRSSVSRRLSRDRAQRTSGVHGMLRRTSDWEPGVAYNGDPRRPPWKYPIDPHDSAPLTRGTRRAFAGGHGSRKHPDIASAC